MKSAKLYSASVKTYSLNQLP